MKNYVLYIIFVLVLAGCSTYTRQMYIYTQDGKIGHFIECSGRYPDWGKCLKIAGNICTTRGYYILDKFEGYNKPKVIRRHLTEDGIYLTQIMLISCKE